MDVKNIYDGVTDIRDDLIEEGKGAPPLKRHRGKPFWYGAIAAVLAVTLIIGAIFLRPGGGRTAYAISQAEYPKMAPYPGEFYSEEEYNAWWEDIMAQRRDLGDISPLQDFFAKSSQIFLTDTQGENKVYSPLNVYIALSMLAQITDGSSREQILTLLGSDSMEALRSQVSDVWNANYRDDGMLTSILANSLWLNKEIAFNQDTMDILAQDFYASSYQGEMGSDAFNDALQEWLNVQTGGLLKDQTEGIEMNSETILALATTIYYKAKWSHDFQKENTSPQTFHSPSGDLEVDFMHQQKTQNYYWGDHFAAVSQSFVEGGSMWFLLPNEGITPEELLSDQEAMEFLFQNQGWKNTKTILVNKAIPKFDVSSEFDLVDGLKGLGVTDVFDPSHSDFTPMITNADLSVEVSRVDHAARVTIDEEGCVAAAFTVALTESAMPPDEEVDFTLDRPFLFCITGESGMPLFVGVVNSPVEK